jgi:hypothetical protein
MAGKAVVMIRLAPSEQAPHAVDNRQKIYIRVDSHSHPSLYRLADLEELDWLFEQRRKGDQFLSTIVEESRARAVRVLEHMAGEDIPVLTVMIQPRFFRGNLSFSPIELRNLLTGERCMARSKHISRPFPETAREGRSIPGGYCLHTSIHRQTTGTQSEYVEINQSGVILSQAKYRIKHGSNRFVTVAELLLQVDGFLRLAERVFSGKASGPLRLHAELARAQGVSLALTRDSIGRELEELVETKQSYDSSITVLDTTVDEVLAGEARLDAVKQAAEAILWAFGYDWSGRPFEEWWEGR